MASAKASPTGKLYRKNFQTKQDAMHEKRRIEEEHRKHGISGTLLDPDIAAQADKAIKLLEPYGVSLLDAAKRIVKQEEQKAKSCTFAELFDAYQNREGKRERREATVANWNNTYNKYDALFGNKLISEIDKEKIRKHMRKFTTSAQANHFRHLRSWFNYAVRQKWMASNPMLELDAPEAQESETGLLNNKQCRDLLNAAAKDWPELLPYVALGIFAGIRPAEIWRLRWEDVNMADRIITVTSDVAKTRRRAGVQINDTLHAWLKDHVKESGAIVSLPEKTFQRHWYACRESVGLYKTGAGKAGNKEIWPHDAMRHTFASNHFAAFRNISELQVEMRHTGNARTLNDHYLNVVTKKDALAFWKIVPKGAKAPKLIKQVS
tara:strand:+ start:1388 stop:2524 length:1137 start_codon:yes stop_codon:yes gene_type:complete